jgi:hypothetical protein
MKRDTWKTSHRWEDNIKMDPQEVGWGGIDLIAVAEDEDRWWVRVNEVVKLQNCVKCGEFLD